MDFGMIVIHLADGRPIVSRCEEVPGGVALVPAANAPDLEAQAMLVLRDLQADFSRDGMYLCTNELQAAAQFGPFVLPADAITYGAARQLLYPGTTSNTGWQKVNRDVKAGKLRVWRVGVGQDTRQYLSRAEVMKLLEDRSVPATT